MSEEDLTGEESQNLDAPEEAIQSGETDAQDYDDADPTERRARQQGWKPYEEWDGDPDEWVGAEAFVVRGELFNKLKKQSKTINELNQVVQDLSEHHKKVKENEFKKAIDYLKRQKKEALEDEDYDKAVEIDDQISETRQDWEKNQQKQTQETVNPEFDEWRAKPENQWYENSRVMRAAADQIAVEYAQSNPKANFQEVVSHVEQEMKKEFPEKFKTGQKKPHSGVNEPSYTGSGSTGKKSKKALVKLMNEEQTKIAKRLSGQKTGLTIEDYAQQLRDLGEI